MILNRNETSSTYGDSVLQLQSNEKSKRSNLNLTTVYINANGQKEIHALQTL